MVTKKESIYILFHLEMHYIMGVLCILFHIVYKKISKFHYSCLDLYNCNNQNRGTNHKRFMRNQKCLFCQKRCPAILFQTYCIFFKKCILFHKDASVWSKVTFMMLKKIPISNKSCTTLLFIVVSTNIRMIYIELEWLMMDQWHWTLE